MSYNLYQLRFQGSYPIGALIHINSPTDRYGYIVEHKDTNIHGTLHVVRGVGNKPDEGIQHELRSRS